MAACSENPCLFTGSLYFFLKCTSMPQALSVKKSIDQVSGKSQSFSLITDEEFLGGLTRGSRRASLRDGHMDGHSHTENSREMQAALSLVLSLCWYLCRGFAMLSDLTTISKLYPLLYHWASDHHGSLRPTSPSPS